MNPWNTPDDMRSDTFYFPGERKTGELPPEVLEALLALVRTVLEALERGEQPPWRKPWTCFGDHYNGSTVGRFTGFNQLLCWCFA